MLSEGVPPFFLSASSLFLPGRTFEPFQKAKRLPIKRENPTDDPTETEHRRFNLVPTRSLRSVKYYNFDGPLQPLANSYARRNLRAHSVFNHIFPPEWLRPMRKCSACGIR